MSETWGPATPLLIAIERDAIAGRDMARRHMAVYLYGPPPVYAYSTPQWVLRRRAVYGGRKGRAAIRRLKALGARPLTTNPKADE